MSDALASWKEFLPEWEVRVLNEPAFRALRLPGLRLPSTWDSLTPTTKSDVVRLSLLCALGGLWMDASVLLRGNLDWLDLDGHAFFAFRIPGRVYLESWFLWARSPGIPQVCEWRDELNAILEHYPDFADAPQYASQPTVREPNYLMVYQAFVHLRASDPAFGEWSGTLPTRNASPHFSLLHPRLVKLTRKTRGLYIRRREIVRASVGGLGGVVVVLVVVWLAVTWRRPGPRRTRGGRGGAR